MSSRPPARLTLAGRQCACHFSHPAGGWPPKIVVLPSNSTPGSPSSSELRFQRNARTPAKPSFTGGSRQLRLGWRSSEERLRQRANLRGANVGRRRMRGGVANFGEAVAVGGDRLLGSFPPAKQALVGGE